MPGVLAASARRAKECRPNKAGGSLRGPAEGAHVTPVAVNEHLAHLLTIQGGLLDAYLEQNLGARYAYAIIVWDQTPGAPLRAVTNCAASPVVRSALRDLTFAAARATRGGPLPLERSPVFVDAPAEPPGEPS